MLIVRDVVKDFGDLLALDGISLEVAAGETLAMVGSNGAGKSTFLRIAAGLLERTSGELTIDGHEPGTIEARAATAFVSDNPVLYDDLSVIEHLEFIARMHDHNDWEERAWELLDVLGLRTRADDLPSRFSRGLRQKTSLAIGFVRPSSLLLIDEPFVGLDASGKSGFLELVASAASSGTAVVVSTHELGFLECADRCVALRDGAVVSSGALNAQEVLALMG